MKRKTPNVKILIASILTLVLTFAALIPLRFNRKQTEDVQVCVFNSSYFVVIKEKERSVVSSAMLYPFFSNKLFWGEGVVNTKVWTFDGKGFHQYFPLSGNFFIMSGDGKLYLTGDTDKNKSLDNVYSLSVSSLDKTLFFNIKDDSKKSFDVDSVEKGGQKDRATVYNLDEKNPDLHMGDLFGGQVVNFTTSWKGSIKEGRELHVTVEGKHGRQIYHLNEKVVTSFVW